MRLGHSAAASLAIIAFLACWPPERSAAQNGAQPPSPPPRPFDLNLPSQTGQGLPARAAPNDAQPAPPQAGANAAPDAAPKPVANAPLPPRRPAIVPVSDPEDEEEEPEAPWPRRTPGQRNLDFEPRVAPENDVIANGITVDPGTSVACLPPPLKRVLDAVVKRYGAVRVTSTFRPAWRARRNSFHRRCQAVDFRVPGQAPRAVLEFVKSMEETGGHKVYWNGLVHVDTGSWRTW
jgi:uncharacterized protein YcbK (DUF882 family)